MLNMQWFISPAGFFPVVSPEMLVAIRFLYGLLMLATLVMVSPQAKRFFISEKWGGFGQSGPDVNFIQNPAVMTLVYLLWMTACAGLITGIAAPFAALFNLICCRYFFVSMRWKGNLRGFGAPGFMSYWLGAVVFFLETAKAFCPEMMATALLAAQLDFAFIMLSAGLYKMTAGYASGNGMEFGMVNPQWGYWWKIWKNVSPRNPVFEILNQLAWSAEVVAGLLMFFPQARFIGGAMMFLSFIFIATQIRLGVLCEIVMTSCLVFAHPGSCIDELVKLCFSSPVASGFVGHSPAIAFCLSAFLWAYMVLLPLAHTGLFYNFYAKKSLPGLLQVCLEKYTNFFGIIIWRVFSADHTSFFPLIYRRDKGGDKRELVSKYGFTGGLRFDNVGECIALTCLFTTLKYYCSNQALFNERLLRYARTIACKADQVLEFEYNIIRKTESCFNFVPTVLYTVDPGASVVEEQSLVENWTGEKLSGSRVFEGARPGSYVPLGS